MLRSVTLLLLVMIWLPAMAAEDNEKRAQMLIERWEEWVKKHEVTKASIAVSLNGALIASRGVGMAPSDPAPVASVSKSITGICMATLVNKGELSFDDKLDRLVTELQSEATVGQLLSHTSGYNVDVTQDLSNYPGRDNEFLEWASNAEIEANSSTPAPGGFHYNNANYAMLGLAIKQVTGKTYEEACNELVLQPVGIRTAGLNPEWRVMSSWGGWMLSAEDHLKFVDAYFNPTDVLGKSPGAFPNHALGNGMHYGMGYLYRTGRHGGTNFWHDGKWHIELPGENHRFAAYFVSFDNGWAVSTNHNISAINDEHLELDRILGEATHLPL